MSARPSRILLGSLITILLFAPAAAHAQDPPDTPDLVVVSAGQGKVRLEVIAGASGAPDGFSVQWMFADALAANGGIWPDGASDEVVRLGFTGVATLNTWGEPELSYRLGPGEPLQIEIGDLTDETGVTGMKVGELSGETEFVFRISALGQSGTDGSELSPILSARTLRQGHNCTCTQGYWKNHTSLWPVPALTLGTVGYSQAQLLQSLLDWSVRGNGLMSLAHQLIAAKLNVANGADPSAIAGAIAAADAMIGSLVVPPIGTGYLPPDATSTLTQALDDYNNGVDGPGHCDTVPAKAPTWGHLKSLYR